MFIYKFYKSVEVTFKSFFLNSLNMQKNIHEKLFFVKTPATQNMPNC